MKIKQQSGMLVNRPLITPNNMVGDAQTNVTAK
jgi:hypothetical protein